MGIARKNHVLEALPKFSRWNLVAGGWLLCPIPLFIPGKTVDERR